MPIPTDDGSQASLGRCFLGSVTLQITGWAQDSRLSRSSCGDDFSAPWGSAGARGKPQRDDPERERHVLRWVQDGPPQIYVTRNLICKQGPCRCNSLGILIGNHGGFRVGSNLMIYKRKEKGFGHKDTQETPM